MGPTQGAVLTSTAPVHSVTPNRSRASSVIPRREIRYPAVNVTTAEAVDATALATVNVSPGNVSNVAALDNGSRSVAP